MYIFRNISSFFQHGFHLLPSRNNTTAGEANIQFLEVFRIPLTFFQKQIQIATLTQTQILESFRNPPPFFPGAGATVFLQVGSGNELRMVAR